MNNKQQDFNPIVNAEFAIIGDFGRASENEEAVANLVKSHNPNFIVTVGDNNYPIGGYKTQQANITDYYGDYIGERFFPALGNHDVETDNGQPHLDYFAPLSRYYVVHKDVVDLFIIDSCPSDPDGTDANSVQAAWLKDQMSQSTAPWKLVFFHHPAFTSGPHGNNAYMDWDFAKMGATAVFSGHDHLYERLEAHGIPYFVNGVGGSDIYDFQPTPIPESQFRYNEKFGAMFVTARQNAISFEFRNVDDELIDSLTL